MILYEVDFTKKNPINIKENSEPAEVIQMPQKKTDFFDSIMLACDLFNRGNLLQSAYHFNKAYEIDAEKDHSNLVDVSILGVINLKLSNFELAQKYFAKSLALKITPPITAIFYHNSVYAKNFKLAQNIKNSFPNMNLKNLCLVKNEKVPLYNEEFNIKKLFAQLIEAYDSNNNSRFIEVFNTLKTIDSTNPYLIQIEHDIETNTKRKYLKNMPASLIKKRFNEIDLFLKSKNKDFSLIELRGIVRFLAKYCKEEKFAYYITEFFKLDNLPPNFVWQCEDLLFGCANCIKKIFILQKLLLDSKYTARNIAIFLKDKLFSIDRIDSLRTLFALNPKMAKSFILALTDVLNSKQLSQDNSFLVEINLLKIFNRIIHRLSSEDIKTERLSLEKLRRCFFILLIQSSLSLKMNFKEEIKALNLVFKKLGYDFDLLNKINQNSNIILVDF